MFRRGDRAPRRSELTAFIDEGSEMEGRYTFHGTVMLNGKFKGEINSNDTLIIGERGSSRRMSAPAGSWSAGRSPVRCGPPSGWN